MATPALSLTSKTCLGCLRLSVLPSTPVSISTTTLQVRGKKNYHPKGSMRDGVIVRLTCNFKGWGPKGTLLRVARGRYRNIWFPNKLALALLPSELKASKIQESDLAVRNPNYGMEEVERKITLDARLKELEMRSTHGQGLDSIIGSSTNPTPSPADLKQEKQKRKLAKLKQKKLEQRQAVKGVAEEGEEGKDVDASVGTAKDVKATKSEPKSKSKSKDNSESAPGVLIVYNDPNTGPRTLSPAHAAQYLRAVLPVEMSFSKSDLASRKSRKATSQPIFGPVTAHDVLDHLSNALYRTNDPVARSINLKLSDLHFVGLPPRLPQDASQEDRRKALDRTGSFIVEIALAGEKFLKVQRSVTVVPDIDDNFAFADENAEDGGRDGVVRRP